MPHRSPRSDRSFFDSIGRFFSRAWETVCDTAVRIGTGIRDFFSDMSETGSSPAAGEDAKPAARKNLRRAANLPWYTRAWLWVKETCIHGYEFVRNWVMGEDGKPVWYRLVAGIMAVVMVLGATSYGIVALATSSSRGTQQTGSLLTGNTDESGLPLADAQQNGQQTGTGEGESAGAAATPAPTATPEPVKLMYGTTDASVTDLQMRLMELEYMDYDEPTEYYGSVTQTAVESFQLVNGLAADGIAGEETLKLLNSDSAKHYAATLGSTGSIVEEIQARLMELGYMDNVTGYFGEETQAAVKEFQERNGLTPDGVAGSGTRAKLYADDVKAKTFQEGSVGEDVEKLQAQLVKLGYLDKADGTFGAATTAAVKRFQESNGLVADGYVGPSTKELLFSSDVKGNALKLGTSGDDVQRIQNRLAALNYMSSSNVTGYFGSVTESAVKKFQSRNGLSADGTVGAQTMSKLFSSSAVKAASGSSGGGSGGNTDYVGDGSKASALVAVASSKLGCPYVWGGKGPNGFDCSGFVYWCINQVGVKQSYMRSTVWATCTKYPTVSSMSKLQVGDILLFSGTNLGHMGIYIGDGMMIDASSSNGKVVKRSIWTNWWTTHFIRAYRVI